MNVIYVGDSMRVDGSDVKKIAVTNSRVIKVTKEDGATIVVRAKSKGSSYLHVWYRSKKEPVKYGFTVISAAVYKKVSELRGALKDIKGIKINSAGEGIYITGIINSQSDYDLINKVVISNKGVFNYTKLTDDIAFGEHSKVVEGLFDIGLYDVSLKDVDGVIFIEASARNKKQIENAEFYLKSALPGGKYDLNLIPYQIDIDVKIVELTSSESRNMGLDVPGEYPLSRHTVLSQMDIESILHLSDARANAKVVSNPSLSANDGETATFHVGGTIPIKLSSRYTASLDWRNYGVILNFTPKVINDDTVELKIASEFSNVDNSAQESNNNNTGAPSFIVREVKTVVTMDSGRAVVISGLVSKSTSKANSGLPGISDIPVLSDIFSSNSNSDEQTDLAIIVTPSVRFRCEELYIDKKLDQLLAEIMSEEPSVN